VSLFPTRRYFLRRLRRVKKANGQIIAVNEVGCWAAAASGSALVAGQQQYTWACSEQCYGGGFVCARRGVVQG
jgi:hypothetical protein